MKIALSLIMILLSFIHIYSQQSSNSQSESNLIIIEKKWYPGPAKPIFEDNSSPALRAQSEAREDLNNPERDRKTSPNNPMVKETTSNTVDTTPHMFFYQVKVKNTGKKTVQRIEWSYQFFDSANNQLLDEKRFGNSVIIKPGETKTLKAQLTQRPLKTFTTKNADKKTRVKPLERVFFLIVSYADSTTWNEFR